MAAVVVTAGSGGAGLYGFVCVSETFCVYLRDGSAMQCNAILKSQLRPCEYNNEMILKRLNVFKGWQTHLLLC